MKAGLDPIVTAGPLRTAAIAVRSTWATGHRSGAAVMGQKQPLAILIARDKRVVAFRANGQPMTRQQIETLCPGAWDKMQSAPD